MFRSDHQRRKVRRAGSRLLGLDNVVAVFFGARQRGGEWRRDDPPFLSVHVTRKQSEREVRATQVVPRRIDGLHTDVLEVGVPRVHSLPWDRVVQAKGSRGHLDRPSTITAMASTPDGPLLLLSGHGGLPYDFTGERPRVERVYPGSSDHRPNDAALRVRTSAGLREGVVTFGQIDDLVDNACAEIPADPVDTTHPTAQTRPPLQYVDAHQLEGEGDWTLALGWEATDSCRRTITCEADTDDDTGGE